MANQSKLLAPPAKQLFRPAGNETDSAEPYDVNSPTPPNPIHYNRRKPGTPPTPTPPPCARPLIRHAPIIIPTVSPVNKNLHVKARKNPKGAKQTVAAWLASKLGWKRKGKTEKGKGDPDREECSWVGSRDIKGWRGRCCAQIEEEG